METQEILLTSDTNLGARDVSSDGSSFTVQLQNGIHISGKRQCSVYVKQSEIWYNTPNVAVGVNNKMYITYGAQSEVLQFDSGLYSFASLSSALSVLLNNVVPGVNPNSWSGIISLIADNSTQKVLIQFNDDSTGGGQINIDWTNSDDIGNILGFPDSQGIITANIGQTVKGNNIAAFNQLNYYLLQSNLVSTGLALNNVDKQIIAKVTIPSGTQVGSQILYEPRNPSKIRSDELLGRKIYSWNIRLTDQNGDPVNTLGEVFSLNLVFEYI